MMPVPNPAPLRPDETIAMELFLAPDHPYHAIAHALFLTHEHIEGQRKDDLICPSYAVACVSERASIAASGLGQRVCPVHD